MRAYFLFVELAIFLIVLKIQLGLRTVGLTTSDCFCVQIKPSGYFSNTFWAALFWWQKEKCLKLKPFRCCDQFGHYHYS